METINYELNYECYVSLEIAKLLKKAEFNWAVKTYYHYLSPYDEYNLEFDSISTNYNHLDNADFSAPSLDVTQRWLRRMKGLFVCVVPEIKDYYATWNFYICNEQGLFYENEDCFLTYEDALGSGEKTALEMILKVKKLI